MIVDGSGMIATAFRAFGRPASPGVVFARGVANSQTLDEGSYARERSLLCEALKWAKEISEPLIYFSGSAVYSDFSQPVTEMSICKPTTRYGQHQVECENLIRQSGAQFLIVRLPNVVGVPGNRHQLLASLVSQILNGKVRVQRNAGRDLLAVEDLVYLVQQVTDLGVTNEVINIASGRSTPVPKIIEQILRTVSAAALVEYYEGGDVQRFDIGRLKALVGSVPFDEDYPARILRDYVPRLALEITSANHDKKSANQGTPSLPS